MKVLILIGSYRKNGNTAQIANLIGEKLQVEAQKNQKPLEIETIFLAHRQIAACRGCRSCFDRGESTCPLNDDMAEIKAKLQSVDGVIIASPVYVDDVNGITKNWIDRLAHVCHRPEFAGKCAYLVVTVGSSPTGHALRTLTTALGTWGFHLTGQAGLKTGALMKPEAMRETFGRKTHQIAYDFFGSIARRAVEKPSFMSLMMFKIQQRAWQTYAVTHPDFDYDLAYWQKHGWLDARCDFYIPHRANRIKVGLARLTGALIARFVT